MISNNVSQNYTIHINTKELNYTIKNLKSLLNDDILVYNSSLAPSAAPSGAATSSPS